MGALAQHAPGLPMLLGGGLGLLLCFIASAMLVLRAQAREQEAAVRVTRISTQYAPSRIVRTKPSATLDDVLRLKERATALLRLLGYDGAKRAHYPASPVVVVLGGFLVASAAAYLLQKLLGSVVLLGTPVLGLFLARLFWKNCDARRQRKLYVQFPDALAMIVRAVRVGVPLTESFSTIAREAEAPTTEEFARLADRIRIGVALEDALAEQSNRVALSEYRFFATALTLQAQTGGGLTETLENLADVIRKRIALRKRAHALASEAKTSATVLAALPVFTAGLLEVINPSYINLLFTTSTGNVVLAAAAGLLGTGGFVMKTIISKSLT